MKTVEATGKKLDDAIKAGLLELGGLTIDDVDVEIIHSGSLFKKAKVRLTVCEDETLDDIKEEVMKDISGAKESAPEVKKFTNPVVKKSEPSEKKDEKREERKPRREKFEKPERKEKPEKKEKPEVAAAPVEENTEAATVPAEEKPVKPVAPEQVEMARSYVTELLNKMGIEATLEISTEYGAIDIEIVTEDSAVIGHHGEVLDSIQILTKRAVEEGEDKRLAVHVDCKGYRQQREKTLIAMANRMAAKAIKTGRKVVLEPMNNSQRKVIHATLNDNNKVFTKSEGHEPNRRVVIIPKRSRRRNYNGNKPNEAPAAIDNE